MMFRITFLLCIFCLYITALFAQNQKTIDSLQNELKSNISDKNKVDIYVNLAKQYSESDSLNSVKYINKAIQLAEKADYPEGKIDALYQKGWLVFSLGYYPEAEMIFQQMIDESDIHHYLKGKGNGYNGLGSIYNYQGNYEKAMESYFTSLEIREDLDDKAGMASSYNNIGNVYDSQGNHEKALEYHLRSLEIEKELGDQMGISLSYTNVGYSYFYQNNYEKALEYHLKALRISEVLQDQLGIATNYVNIGDIHVKQGNYEKALEAYPKAIEIAKKIGYKEVLSNSFTGLGGVYVEQKQWVLAREYLKKGLEVGQEIGLLASIRDASKKLSLVEEKLGNHQAAYQYHLLFKEMADSLRNDELTQKVTRLEAEYEFQQEKDSIQFANQAKQSLLEKDIENRQNIQIATFIGLGLALALVIVLVFFFRNQKQNNQKLNQANEEIKTTLDIVEYQRDEILSSIQYAQRIQASILPRTEYFQQLLPEYFIFFKPRDVVSGDFYWLSRSSNNIILAAIDCTGHGVPGAFMSMVGNDLLNSIVKDKHIAQANEILTQLHKDVRQALQQKETNTNDGMDMALVNIDLNNQRLQFAGAQNPLIYIQNKELHQLKGDIMSIGGVQQERDRIFTLHEVDISTPTTFYLFSDGYQDQFGGKKGKKFMTKRFRELLFEIYEKPMEEQKSILEKTLKNWMGEEEQVDDILVMGVKV